MIHCYGSSSSWFFEMAARFMIYNLHTWLLVLVIMGIQLFMTHFGETKQINFMAFVDTISAYDFLFWQLHMTIVFMDVCIGNLFERIVCVSFLYRQFVFLTTIHLLPVIKRSQLRHAAPLTVCILEFLVMITCILQYYTVQCTYKQMTAHTNIDPVTQHSVYCAATCYNLCQCSYSLSTLIIISNNLFIIF